jgi:RHS repeat-associated protein
LLPDVALSGAEYAWQLAMWRRRVLPVFVLEVLMLAAARSRFVLGVAVLGAVAAFFVALLAGETSEAATPASSSTTAAKSASLAPPSGTGDVVALRSEFARSYRRADGSMRTMVSSVPINYRDASGRWQPVDTTLRADGGGVRSTAAAVDLSLPHDLSVPVKVAKGSDWVSFSMKGASSGATVEARGSSASYAGVLTGVDATYAAQAHGVKETLTLADRSAPSTLTFTLKTSAGLTPVLRADGSLALRDGDGETRFFLPAPTVQAAGDERPTTDHVAYRLSADKTVLAVVVDADWLAGARFPVKVDPTVFDGAGVTACNLAGGSLASTSDCASALLKVGYDGTRARRAALRWGSLASDGIPVGAAIDYAQMGLVFESMTNGTAHPQIDVAALGHTVASGATWNTYDGTNAWTTAGGDTDASATQVQPLPWGPNFLGDAGEPLGWDVSGLVQSWLRDPSTNHGVRVKAHDETINNVMSFDSPTGAAQGPWLAIDWRNRPGNERDQSYEGVGINDRSGLAVNVVSGNLDVSGADIHLPGVAGLDLDVHRDYNTGDLADQHLSGSAWITTVNGAALDLETHFLSGGRTLYANGGAIYRFDRDTGADATVGGVLMYGYTTPSGIDATMQQNSTTGATTITFRDGTAWTYSGGSFYGQILTQVKDRHNNHIDLTYDSLWGNSGQALKKITDTYGRDLTVTRTLPSGTVTGMTDSSGRHWAWGVDAGDHYNLDTATDPDNKTVSYAYDTTIPTVWDMLKKVTDARGHDITLGYGGSSGASQGSSLQLTSLTRAVDANSAHNIVWRWNYTPAGGVGTACTATGVVGRTVETDPEGHLTTYCYNSDGRVVQAFDANGRSTKSTYNAQGNVAQFTGLAGTANPSLTTYGFAANGNATGASTKVDSTHTQASTIKYCDDPLQPACSSSSYGQAKYQPTLATDSQGTSQAFAYNTTGDLTDVTTPSGSDHQQLHYTTAGEVDWSKDGNLRQTTYGYTSHFLTSVTPPAPLSAQSFTADSLDRIHTATDGAGQTATVTYDGEDRITRVDWSPSNKWMTFTYDNDGNVTQRADGTSTTTANTTTYGYDYANRRTSEGFPSSRTNAYVYDRASNLTSLTDPDGVVSYTYDLANRLASVTSPKPTSGTDTITYSYTDPAASTDPSKVTVTYPGSGGVTGTGLKQETTSDAAGNVLSIKVLNSSGTTLKSRTYVHTTSATSTSTLIQTVVDEAGNVTTYTHGASDRLTRAKTVNGATPVDQWDYLFDAAGNRTRRTRTVGAGSPVATSYAYNTANEMCWSVPGTTPGTCSCPTTTTCTATPGGGTTYTYDANGQRTTGASYDALERLTTLGGTTLSYLSPGNGELVGYGTTGYQSNLMGLARQIPSSGGATDVIRVPNGAPVAQRVGTTSKQSLFSDALGSMIAMADDGANALSRHYTYDPDGNVATTGSGATTNLLFASGHQVGGLYHFGARYYDPLTATWTQQDPINQIASLAQSNHYSYVGGAPVDLTDPTGLSGGSEGGCELGPASISGSRDDDSSSSSLNYGVGLGAGLGCYGYRYKEDTGNGLSAGGHVCAIACAGIDSDSGLKFGLGVDVSIGVDINLSL